MSEKEYLKQVGMEFRVTRIRNGLTLQKLSELTNLSYPAIQQIEKGITAPSLLTIKRMADALGKPLADFV